MDTEELLRRLRECEGRKSPYMQKEPPERLPMPESAPSQYIQKVPPPERLPGPGYGSKRKYLPPVPIREFGYRTADFRDRDRNGIDDRDERSAIDRMMEAEIFRNKYGRGYGY